MFTDEIFAFASAVGAGVLALIAALRAGRSIAHWAFVAGMLVLVVERACSGMATQVVLPEEVNLWLQRRGLAVSFLPGFWLLFSLTYARENAREFLQRW